MATTPRGYPYPTLDDPPDGASQMQALAAAIDTDLTGSYYSAASVLLGRDTALTVTPSTQTSPASFNLGVLLQRNTGAVVYQGSGVIQIKTPGMWCWHATINWPDTTLVHRRKVSVKVNNTNFGIGAQTSWIFGSATGDTDTAGGMLPITQANVDAGGTVTLVIYQSSTANMSVVPASFGVYRIS